MMTKCQICKSAEAAWAWQPFGPDPQWTFSTLGNHYRGFPVIKVCAYCYRDIQDGGKPEFEYKGKRYLAAYTVVLEIPDDISDGLAYYERWLDDIVS